MNRRVCALTLCVGAFAGAEPLRAATYFVDPARGDDSRSGSAIRPWRTLAASFPRLRAGDVLYLRGGTYFESGLEIAVGGEPSLPIAIQSWPGERAVIDGGYPEFREVPNNQWEPVDAKRGLYRSLNEYPGRVLGFLEHKGKIDKLVPYETLADLRAANEFYVDSGSLYVGHGIHWNPENRRIYVRLVPSKLQLFLDHSNPPALDPNRARLLLFSDGVLLRFDGQARHLRLEGVDFVDQGNAIEFRTGAHHIEVRDAEIRAGLSHVVVRDEVHHLLFDGVEIDGHVPPWITWEDVKLGTDPAGAFGTSAFLIQDGAHDVEIRNCRIHDAWDGITAVDQPHGLRIHHNEFLDVRDDAVQLGSGGYDHEIHHNAMIDVSKGVSRHGSGSSPRPGTTWVHHNVIDTSRRMQYGRERSPGVWPAKAEAGANGRVWARPFGSHHGRGFGQGDAWRIYHNTLVFGKDLNGFGAGHTLSSRAGFRHEVLNNVFVQIADQAIAREARSLGGQQVYDGNLYHRTLRSPSTALFRSYVDDPVGDLASRVASRFRCATPHPCWDATASEADLNADGWVGVEDLISSLQPGGEQTTSFDSLAEFLASPFQAQTRSFYAPGWEAESVEADPELDDAYVPSAAGPAATGAVLLPPGYPGDESERHRGALGPGDDPDSIGPHR